MRKKYVRPNYEERREYHKLYRRFTYHFGDFLDKAFDGEKALTIEQLADRLAEISASDPAIGRPIHLQPEVLRKYIKRYQRKDGEDRFTETITYTWKKPVDEHHD